MPVTRHLATAVKLLVGLAALAGIALAAGFYLGIRQLEAPYQGFAGEEIVVTIPAGASVRESLDQLDRAGVLTRPLLARLYWKYRLEDPVLIAGEYRFRGPASAIEVLQKITRGEVLTHQVTVLEGLTYEEIAEHLAVSGFGVYDAFISEMSSPDRISDFDAEAGDLEGYLFPDTYAFSRGTSEASIVDTMVATFRARFADATALVGSETEYLSPRELVTLASIVEKEALADGERLIIAGVYANRLARGMGLYSDPTIIYALKREGRWDGNLRRRDLEMDSPYNTYRVKGLPPSPICSPGLASLEAAAAPAEVPYLYFVSRNDGTHVFATTLQEHNRNVYQWQKLYWQRRWAEERGQQ
ncbi:MAG: endolytic transglycosylase MltG [Thermoanaerobaculia bacterium]